MIPGLVFEIAAAKKVDKVEQKVQMTSTRCHSGGGVRRAYTPQGCNSAGQSGAVWRCLRSPRLSLAVLINFERSREGWQPYINYDSLPNPRISRRSISRARHQFGKVLFDPAWFKNLPFSQPHLGQDAARPTVQDGTH